MAAREMAKLDPRNFATRCSYDQNYQPIYRDSVDVDESFDETRFVTPTHEYTNPRDRWSPLVSLVTLNAIWNKEENKIPHC